MTVEIRFAESPDVPVIVHLIKSLAKYEKLEQMGVANEEKVSKALFGERPYAETLIAELDGKPVGLALFFGSFSAFLAPPGLYLEDLFVEPGRRGAGIGRALLQKLAEIAIGRDCGRLGWAVLDWNKEAIGFYERLGATPNDEWTV